MYMRDLKKVAEYYVKYHGWENVCGDFESITDIKSTLWDCYDAAESGVPSIRVKRLINTNETDVLKLFALEIMSVYGLYLFTHGTGGLKIISKALENGVTLMSGSYPTNVDRTEYVSLDRDITEDVVEAIMRYAKNNPKEVINRMPYANNILKIKEQEIVDNNAGRRSDKEIANDYDFGFQ